MNVLSGNVVTHAIERRIRQHMPNVMIKTPFAAVMASPLRGGVKVEEYSIDEFLEVEKKHNKEHETKLSVMTIENRSELPQSPQVPVAALMLRLQSFPLNVFSERGGVDSVTGRFHDPNNAAIYPFIFIHQLERSTIGRSTAVDYNITELSDKPERFFYNYYMMLEFHININPFNREQVPLLQEELKIVDLDLERILQYIDLFQDFCVPTDRRRSTIQNGVLHFSVTVPIAEDTLPPHIQPVQRNSNIIFFEGEQD